MAGTNRSLTPQVGGPAIILVEPQLGENIGMVARAMLNCGLTDLRLVRPRDGWPSGPAAAAASGADQVLTAARLFDSPAEAIADLHHVFATTARPRDMLKPVLTPRQAATAMRAASLEAAVGVLFGPERSGLTNDELALADSLLDVPLNPAFKSLNLAQAVLLIGYEWFQLATDEAEGLRLGTRPVAPAPKGELFNFFERLEHALDETGFLYPPEKRPAMVRNLRNMFHRMAPTDQDLRTLHGVIVALRHGPLGPPKD